MKRQIKEKLRIDIREKYRSSFFQKWEGRELNAHHRFVSLNDGSLIMYFSLPGKNKKQADLVIQSNDDGKTWNYYTDLTTWPPSNLGIFRIGRYSIAIKGWESFWQSYDYERTWGPERPIPSSDKHFVGLGVPNCFSAIMIQKGTYAGRIVLVADHFLGQEGPDAQLIGSIYTDDFGDTWHSSPLFWPPDPLPKGPEGFGEPAVVEMPSGWLWMVMRTLYGELWQSISRDGGASWRTPSPTGLASPISNCYAKREPQTGATVLCWNLTKPGISTDFRDRSSLYRPRTNLVFSVSKDNCRTWTCPVTVEEKGGFYPTIHFTEKSMFLMYQSTPDETKYDWHEFGLTLVSYDRREVLALPAWTRETIQPFIEKGLVAHWLALACDKEPKKTIN